MPWLRERSGFDGARPACSETPARTQSPCGVRREERRREKEGEGEREGERGRGEAELKWVEKSHGKTAKTVLHSLSESCFLPTYMLYSAVSSS